MCIFDCNPCELISRAASLAVIISNDHTKQETAILSAFFTALGDNLAIISLE